MNKTTAVIITVTALLGACSDSSPVGFVDAQKVVSDSKVGKEYKAAADEGSVKAEELRAAAERANQAYRKSIENKVKEEDQQPLAVAAGKAGQAVQAEMRRQQDAAGALEDRINVVVARLAQARGIKLVMPLAGKPPYFVPSADLTAEVISRLDADPRPAADEVAKLRNELAAARAEIKKGGPGK